MQGTGARVHAHTMIGLAVGRELPLERGHLASQGELARFQYALNRGVYLVLDRGVLGFEVDEWNHAFFP